MAKVLKRLDIVLFANTAQYRSELRETNSETQGIFENIGAKAKGMAKVGAAAFAGLAAAGAVAVGAMIKEQIELTDEMTRLSKIANTNVQDMQKLSIAAKSVGVEQDKLGDIYKDTQDKIGDFLSSGGGAMADFFENIAPQVGVTAEQFRELSGPDALQLYYDSLQEANLGQAEMVFYMEAIASDATDLIPLLHDGGVGFDVWARAAENAGAIMDNETLRATQELKATTDLLTLSYDGAKNQFVQGFLPVISDVAAELVSTEGAADAARVAGEYFGKTLRVVAATGVGVVAIIKAIGKGVYGLVQAFGAWGNVMDGVDTSSPFAFFQIAKNIAWDIPKQQLGILGDTLSDITVDLKESDALIGRIMHMGTTGTNSTVDAVVNLNQQQQRLNTTLGQTGQQYRSQAEAAKKAADAKTKAAKASSLIPKATSDAIIEGAKRLGINPNDLAAVISFETSGTFSTNARNPTSSATGLIQFMEATDGKKDGKYYGHTRDQFGALLPLQQMEYVVKYLKERGIGPGSGVGDIYDAVAGYGYKRGTRAYALNKVWDVNKDGVVAKGEAVQGKRFKQHIRQYYDDGVSIAQSAVQDVIKAEEQMALQRQAIRLESANEITRIQEQLKTKIAKIQVSGFSAEEEAILIADAEKRARIEIEEFEATQKAKIDKLAEFTKTERQLIEENSAAKIAEINHDLSLTDEARKQAIDYIKQRTEYEINQYELTRDKQLQQAAELLQTDEERIRAKYELERREIQLTINMDEDLRKAKIENLNMAEQAALDELRIAHENELQQLTAYGKTEIQRIRDEYSAQRRFIDSRGDIGDGQKSELRNALAGSEIHAIRGIQKPAQDALNAQRAEQGGYSQKYQLQQQYQQQLTVIEDAMKAELLTVEQYEQEKLNTRMEYQRAATDLALAGAEQIAGSASTVARSILGENSAVYRAMFAFEKGIAIARSVLAIQTGIAQAAALPFPANIPAMVTVASQTASIISNLHAVRAPAAPALPGYQAGGFTGYAPTDQIVGYVHGQETVINAPMTSKYRRELEAMNNGEFDRMNTSDQAPVLNLTIENNSNEKVTPTRDNNGDIRLIVGEEIERIVPAQLAEGNSPISRSLRSNWHVSRNV